VASDPFDDSARAASAVRPWLVPFASPSALAELESEIERSPSSPELLSVLPKILVSSPTVAFLAFRLGYPPRARRWQPCPELRDPESMGF
jgi:hypothetical protein